MKKILILPVVNLEDSINYNEDFKELTQIEGVNVIPIKTDDILGCLEKYQPIKLKRFTEGEYRLSVNNYRIIQQYVESNKPDVICFIDDLSTSRGILVSKFLNLDSSVFFCKYWKGDIKGCISDIKIFSKLK